MWTQNTDVDEAKDDSNMSEIIGGRGGDRDARKHSGMAAGSLYVHELASNQKGWSSTLHNLTQSQ
jgi:hypothetical protein